MEFLRTPESNFENLPGYDFAPHYFYPDGQGEAAEASFRTHYIDENPEASQVVLLMHGEPSWSFLYRKMIPVFKAAGYRVIAPDLIGFGKSDKPVSRDDYTYKGHVDQVASFLEHLDLKNITLFCQDWGGLIGLRVAAENQERFARIVVGNSGLPVGDENHSPVFMRWRKTSQTRKVFNVGEIVKSGCVRPLSPEVLAAYDAPYPDESYKAGARKFPLLVPVSTEDPASEANQRAWEVLRTWEKPFLCTFSDSDPITKGGHLPFRRVVPGAKGQNHVIIKEAGHFLQEDKGEELANVIVEFMEN